MASFTKGIDPVAVRKRATIEGDITLGLVMLRADANIA
jgi:hypothetical protein